MTNFTTWRSLVDGQDLFAIPDSGDLHAHYDFSEYSGTGGFNDLSGNGHDLVNGSITGVGESINGVQAGEFDGTDDSVRTDSFTDIGTHTAFAVVRPDGPEGNNNLLSVQQSDHTVVEWQEFDDRGWSMATDGEFNFSDNTTTETAILTSVNNADTNVLRLNGAEILAYSASAGVADVIGIGSREPFDATNYFEGAVGEVPVYPSEKSTSKIEEIESYLADKWGVSLS